MKYRQIVEPFSVTFPGSHVSSLFAVEILPAVLGYGFSIFVTRIGDMQMAKVLLSIE